MRNTCGETEQTGSRWQSNSSVCRSKVMPFSKFGLHPELLRGVKDLGFSQPTPIQKDAIPAGISGKDVLACAATGSGKTAAFGLPILNFLMSRPRGKSRVLIITPTREL